MKVPLETAIMHLQHGGGLFENQFKQQLKKSAIPLSLFALGTMGKLDPRLKKSTDLATKGIKVGQMLGIV